MRNILRSPVRTGVVSLLVGLGLALAIMSLSINVALEQQVETLSSELGTQFEVRPAGSFGGFGAAEPMDESILEEIADLPHVLSIDRVLTVNYRSERNRTILTGIESVENLTIFGGGSANLVSGRYFTDSDQGQMTTIISADLAEENLIGLGDLFIVGEMSYEIVGLFDSETRFGRMSIFVPLQTLQIVSEQEGMVSQATVTADHLENIEVLVSSIREFVGEDVDVIIPQEQQLSTFENSLSTMTGANSTNLFVALTVAGITIFFTLLLAVKERAREIGVLKALGASASDLITGFAWEGLTLAILGCLVGVIIFGTAGQAAAGWFLDNTLESSNRNMTDHLPDEIQGGGQRGGGFIGIGQGRNSLVTRFNPASLFTENLQVSLSPGILVTIFATAAFLGTLGGLLPALLALRLRPAEVLRND